MAVTKGSKVRRSDIYIYIYINIHVLCMQYIHYSVMRRRYGSNKGHQSAAKF